MQTQRKSHRQAHAAQRMQDEVFPLIERYCKKRGELRFLDEVVPLAVEPSSTQHAETQLLRLKSIALSRPFFVCILGSQYGSPIEK
jgi:hypothetical protein